MAEVYLAEQGSLRRQVAVKVLKSRLAADGAYVERFHHEAQAAASLVHANIVQIYDVGEAEGVHYIAQEYVQGLNLQEYLVRRGAPDLKLAASIIGQVAAALQKASAAGIVHRDIKPENIMLAAGGEVKVADFGLARLTGSAAHLTQVGLTMGTPLYMSPEQVEGRPVDPRSDIYSLGVTSYQMLSGVLPFQGDTALGVALKHLRSAPAPLESLRPDLPPGLCRMVHKMLAKSPDDRYPNARELLGDLRNLQLIDPAESFSAIGDVEVGAGGDLADRGALARRLQAAMQTTALATATRRRRRRWYAVAAVAACAAGALSAWATRPKSLLAEARLANVTRLASPREQLVLAKISGSEEWLKSVERFWPHAEREVNLARQDLARRYLYHNRLAEAMALFAEFAKHEDLELRAFGLAGQSIVLARQGDYQKSAELLATLLPLREKLDPTMKELIAAALKLDEQASRRALGRDAEAAIEHWRQAELAVPLEDE
jgi:serine/threonine-protein kinase